MYDFIILLVAFFVWFLWKNNKKKSTSHKNTNKSKEPNKRFNNCYYVKKRYITRTEMDYAYAIQRTLPTSYILLPQVCLASIIEKHSDSKYQSELFRIVDFGIFDNDYNVQVLIEINDSTHKQADRIERDRKVKEICSMANIPLITLWTQYGINENYIKEKIAQYIR